MPSLASTTYKFSLFAINAQIIAMVSAATSICKIPNHKHLSHFNRTNPARLTSWFFFSDFNGQQIIRSASDAHLHFIRCDPNIVELSMLSNVWHRTQVIFVSSAFSFKWFYCLVDFRQRFHLWRAKRILPTICLKCPWAEMEWRSTSAYLNDFAWCPLYHDARTWTPLTKIVFAPRSPSSSLSFVDLSSTVCCMLSDRSVFKLLRTIDISWYSLWHSTIYRRQMSMASGYRAIYQTWKKLTRIEFKAFKNEFK